MAKLSLKAETSRMEMDFWKPTRCQRRCHHFHIQHVLSAIPYFCQEERHKKGKHNFSLVFKSLHVLKCDLSQIVEIITLWSPVGQHLRLRASRCSVAALLLLKTKQILDEGRNSCSLGLEKDVSLLLKDFV